MADDCWMTVYCLECKETTSGNGWGLAPETGTVVCRRCRGILTKVIEPADFVPVPLHREERPNR
jgi:hypothetical protein